MTDRVSRRGFLKACAFASAGAVVGWSIEEKVLLARATAQAAEAKPENRPTELPTGRIGHLKISRLICGGNLINGYAHARDLIYVSSLMKQYFTDEKIMDTWERCEESGINTMISTVNDPYAGGKDPTLRVVKRYRKERGGRIQWIAQCFPREDDLTTILQLAVDNGADGIFIQGQVGDNWGKNGRLDLIEKVISFVKQNGLIAGVACHSIKAPKAIQKAGIEVDFYMKTLHRGDYWSATPKEKQEPDELPAHDNMWCVDSDETIEFMRTVKKPWIAYKVLAAGAIPPEQGFRYAYENGADFLCVGMFDFQVAEDTMIAKNVLSGVRRERPWAG
ncbi:MAG: twin-arginine translocation signal domain-containing protein [bacterium]|nr:twin-arginine translocation signal domain-containing protein [bacterium]